MSDFATLLRHNTTKSLLTPVIDYIARYALRLKNFFFVIENMFSVRYELRLKKRFGT